MASLSLVLVALNEERTIGQVLSAAAPLAEEIILVDSGSRDQTVEIAKNFGANVVHQDWLGYARQKNFALSLASHEWVLSLDADEVLTEQLVLEIKELLGSTFLEQYDGFKIPRILFIGQQAITHGGFYPDAQLRLFRKSKGIFKERLVHEAVSLPGRVGRLQQPMHHFAYADLTAFAGALEKYARLSAEEFASSGYSPWAISALNECLHPLWTFIYRYLIRLGFLDGWLALELNLLYSDYVRKKIRYLREQIKQEQPPG